MVTTFRSEEAVKKYYVRRKDLSPFPFQFYYDRQGVQHKLSKGETFTFAIHPQKDKLDGLHVHISKDFIEEAERRWDIYENEMMRIAAKAMENWLLGEAIPEEHFNGLDMILIDLEWYPQESSGKPAGKPGMIPNPFDFMVTTSESGPVDAWWQTDAAPGEKQEWT
jgi:hypothetical protein